MDKDKKYLCDEYLKEVRNKYVGQIQIDLEKFVNIEKYTSEILKNTEPNRQAYLPLYILDIAKILELPIKELPEKFVAGEEDEILCLNQILQSVVDVEVGSRRYTRKLVQLIGKAANMNDFDDSDIDEEEALLAIKRFGLGLNKDRSMLYVSNNHLALKKIMRGTRYANNWRRILIRLKGAEDMGSCYFGPGVYSRAVGIWLSTIFDIRKNEK